MASSILTPQEEFEFNQRKRKLIKCGCRLVIKQFKDKITCKLLFHKRLEPINSDHVIGFGLSIDNAINDAFIKSIGMLGLE